MSACNCGCHTTADLGRCPTCRRGWRDLAAALLAAADYAERDQ